MCTLYRVVYFWVVLECINISALIGNCRKGRVLACTDDFESFRNALRFVAMAHPYDLIVTDAFEDRRLIFDFKSCFSILVMVSSYHFTAEVLGDQLHPVTDTKNRQPQVPDSIIRFVGIFRIHRGRPSRKDDPLRFACFDLFDTFMVWYYLCVDT